MKITTPKGLLPEERLLAVDPPPANRVDDAWNRRPRYYTGRSLTAGTLELQDEHDRQHLNIYGRQLSDGIVRGLEAEAEFAPPEAAEPGGEEEPPTPRESWWLEIGPGIGVMGSGLDVSLPQRRRILFADLPVYDDAEATPEGVGVVLLEPVVAETIANADPEDPCEHDPDLTPFEDRQQVEGVRVTWLPWPEEFAALPTDDAHFRNRLAHRIFEHERANPTQRPPWEAIGVALALVRLNADGSVDFLDRFAVARQGGAPLSVLPKLQSNGWPFMWQARMQQMLAHLYDLQDSGADISPGTNHFRFVPPVGSLPKEMVDLENLTTEFFPGQYFIEAAPVPLDQLDVAVEGAASLSPFDLYQADRVKLLVPVPAGVYEPRLLIREEVDPIFLRTLRRQVTHLNQVRTNRDALRDMSDEVVGSIELDDVPEYPDPDPDSVADEVAQLPFTIPDPAADLDDDFSQNALDVLAELRDWFDASPDVFADQVDELNQTPGTDFAGLEAFIQDLQQNIETTNDKLETVFGEVQSDLYRLRQMLLGNEKASRLATSPALKDVAVGRRDTPSVEAVSEFFKKARVQEQLQQEAPAAGEAAGEAESATEEVVTGNAFLMMQPMLFNMNANADNNLINMSAMESTGGFDFFGAGLAETESSRLALGIEPEFALADNTIKYRLYEKPLFMRTLTVDARVYTPPSVEAKNEAVSRKVTVFETLQRVPISIEGVNITLRTGSAGIFWTADYNSMRDAQPAAVRPLLDARRVEGDEYVALDASAPTNSELEGLSTADATAFNNALLAATQQRNIELASPDLVPFTKRGLFDPDPPDGDEAAYFSAGIIALEDAIAAIRQVEQRLALFRLGLKQARNSLISLQQNLVGWQKTLSAVGDQLAEVRHDVTVARALYEEEKQRVQGINDRRRRILQNEVPFVTFMRPRLGSSVKDQPSVQLYGEFKDPVPAILAEDFEATDELEEMLDLFREVPLAWLPHAKPLLYWLDRPEYLYDVMSYARNRAKTWLQTDVHRVAVPTVGRADKSARYGQAVGNMLKAYRSVKTNWYQRRSAMQLPQLQSVYWQQAQRQAAQDLSLADLIEAGRGRSSMARKATEEMERLEDVAVALYNRCGDVLPAVRLRWADAISVYDRPVDLRSLANLPEWGQVDFELRRELQRLVEWLFSRVDGDYEEAVRLMNDLVRVCILLASHAPVSSIIGGHVPAPTTGSVGDVIDLNLDRGRARIGMQVAVYSGNRMAAQGVVEDLSAQAVRVKVTQSAQANKQFVLEQGARAQFYNDPTKAKAATAQAEAKAVAQTAVQAMSYRL